MYLNSGDDEIAEYTASGSTLARRTIPGPSVDHPIAMVDYSSGTAVTRFFYTDRQGSVVAMSDASGNGTEGPYTYDAYGNCVTGGQPCSGGVPYKYTGRRYDPETGLYYYRARYYSAPLGRFLQTDPIGYKDNLNWYAYVGNDPVNGADPTGLVDARCDQGGVLGCEGEVTADGSWKTVGAVRVPGLVGSQVTEGPEGTNEAGSIYNAKSDDIISGPEMSAESRKSIIDQGIAKYRSDPKNVASAIFNSSDTYVIANRSGGRGEYDTLDEANSAIRRLRENDASWGHVPASTWLGFTWVYAAAAYPISNAYGLRLFPDTGLLFVLWHEAGHIPWGGGCGSSESCANNFAREHVPVP